MSTGIGCAQLRDPVAAVFSAEIMVRPHEDRASPDCTCTLGVQTTCVFTQFRDMGFPLTWSLCDEIMFDDGRFQACVGPFDSSCALEYSNSVLRRRK